MNKLWYVYQISFMKKMPQFILRFRPLKENWTFSVTKLFHTNYFLLKRYTRKAGRKIFSSLRISSPPLCLKTLRKNLDKITAAIPSMHTSWTVVVRWLLRNLTEFDLRRKILMMPLKQQGNWTNQVWELWMYLHKEIRSLGISTRKWWHWERFFTKRNIQSTTNVIAVIRRFQQNLWRTVMIARQ